MSPKPSPRQFVILVVEDETIVAADLERSLQDLGYEVLEPAGSSEEALARVHERRPDLALMDIRIQGPLDGIGTAHLLRERFGIPTIYLTAYSDGSTLERAKSTEPYGFLLKPINVRELRSTLEVALHKHESDMRHRTRERWLSTVLHSIADAVVSTSPEGRVTFLNGAAERLTGWPANDALDKPLTDVVQLLDERTGKPAAELEPFAIAGRREVPPRRYRLVPRTGPSERIVHDSVAPVLDGERLLGSVMVLHDVTELTRLMRQLESADRLVALGTLAAGIAHEMRNPLAVVAIGAENLQEALRRAPPLPPSLEVDETVADIRTAAQRMETIVRDVQGLSMMGPVSSGVCEVAPVVQWAVRTTSAELRHRAQVRTEIAPTRAVGLAETHLGQVLINLLVNAGHAVGEGEPSANEILVRVEPGCPGEVVLTVSDTGEGMAPDTVARIFEPFFTTKPAGKGTGLGLYICHSIVTHAGGRLEVESTPGKGSSFRVILPEAPPEATAVPS